MGVKRLFAAATFLLCTTLPALAGQLLPNAQQVFLGQNGTVLSGGLVYTYVPGTTTAKLTYQDPGLSVPNTNPIALDANGQARIWASGSFREVVTDTFGTLVWDQVTVTPGNLYGPASSTAGGFAVWADSTGTTLLDTTPNLTWIVTGGIGMFQDNGLAQILVFNLVPPAAGATAALLVQATGHGDGATPRGQIGISALAGDDSSVTSLNKGELQGANVAVKPLVVRNNTPNDDVVGLVVSNIGPVQARSAFFTGHSCLLPCTQDWVANLELDAPAAFGITFEAAMDVGIDFASVAPVIPVPIKFKNNTALFWRNAANSADIGAVYVDSADVLRFGTGSPNTATVDKFALFQPLVTTVGLLPACSTPGKIAVVTDASGPTWGNALVGTGGVVTIALCTGTTWIAG